MRDIKMSNHTRLTQHTLFLMWNDYRHFKIEIYKDIRVIIKDGILKNILKWKVKKI